MRMSEFWQLMGDEFGPAYSRTLAADHVVAGLGHRTAEQALTDGEEPRAVWTALCDEFDVPVGRRWGVDPGVSRASNRRSS